MSEEARSYRHTAGDWGKHHASEFKPVIVGEDTDKPWIASSVYLSSGDKLIAEVFMWSPFAGRGWPRVDNIPEMKANLALISAAPNMLEYLAEELAMYESGDEHAKSERIEKLKSIIAKATTY